MPKREADWISIDEALERMMAGVSRIGTESVAINELAGRVLAEAVTSPLDLPPWDNSAMDGFAVRAADIEHASKAAPARLRLTESVPAGAFATKSLSAGEAIKIMTGAAVPAGADSVVRLEHTEEAGGDVVVYSGTDAHRNIRPRGEDVRKDEVVLDTGRLLRAGEIGLLASIGRASVRVALQPRVAVLSTGDELIDIDGFDRVLAGERIVNSNSYALGAAIASVGGTTLQLGIARDDRESLRACIRRGLEADVLVTSAGASVGEHDLVKDVLEELGAHTDFWRVRMRPGSPFSFSVVNGVPVFGLPGNPVSAIVTFEVLVKPVLRFMQGHTRVAPAMMTATLAHGIESKAGLTQFLRVLLEEKDGRLIARLTGPQGSGMLSSIARADGLMVVPEDVDALAEGDLVKIIRLD